MLKEVLIVEGKNDTLAVRRALEAETIETGGFALPERVLRQIELAYAKRGIIILTDPDGVGERIRHRLTELFPEAGQAFIPVREAKAHGDVGVEQASPEAILRALEKVRHHEQECRTEFSEQDLYAVGMSGSEEASVRRARLGEILGIGYGNVKKITARLNSYGVTRAEFAAAVEEIDREWKDR